ncbi:unnamed protein product [Rhizopus stolonifer]
MWLIELKKHITKIITFLLFSSNGLLEFEMNEGALLEEEETEIEVKLKLEIIRQSQLDQAFDKLLVLIDQQFQLQLVYPLIYHRSGKQSTKTQMPFLCSRERIPCTLFLRKKKKKEFIYHVFILFFFFSEKKIYILQTIHILFLSVCVCVVCV